MNTPTRSAKAPTHEVFAVSRKEPKEKGRWTKIGACWPHEDGEGFNLRLDLLPLDGVGTGHPQMEAEARDGQERRGLSAPPARPSGLAGFLFLHKTSFC